MKTRIHLFTTLIASMLFTQIVGSAKTPVEAYKDKGVDTNTEWTIGIYDAQNQPISENVVFKKNTKFLSGKGKNLFFNFYKAPNYVYVYKGNAGDGKTGKNLAQENLPGTLKSDPIKKEDVPKKTKIKIKNDKIVLDVPTTTLWVYITEQALYEMKSITVKSSKIEDENADGDNLYGKPVTINKFSIHGFKLTIPLDKAFYIFSKPLNKPWHHKRLESTQFPDRSLLVINVKNEFIYAEHYGEAMGVDSRLQDVKIRRCDLCDAGTWTAQISDNHKRLIGEPVNVNQPTTIKIPQYKPFSIKVTGPNGCSKETTFGKGGTWSKTILTLMPDCGAEIKS